VNFFRAFVIFNCHLFEENCRKIKTHLLASSNTTRIIINYYTYTKETQWMGKLLVT
jgi:hypothetical protein